MRVLNFRLSGFVARVPAVAALALTAACGGPAVADLDQGEVRITVAGVAGKPEVAAIGDAQGGLAVSRSFLSASAMTLIPCRSGAGNIELDARGYELISDPPMSERVSTAVYELCGLQLDIQPVAENVTAGVPQGASLYIEGQDADGADFSLESETSTSLRFETDDGSAFGDQPLLLGFDVSTWLAGLPLPADMADASATQLDSQLVNATALYADSNRNGALDADEQTPIARATTR